MRPPSADARRHLAIALLCGLLAGPAGAADVRASSSAQLKAAIYAQHTAQSGCIRLLNATHELGCAGVGEAPLALHAAGSVAGLREDRVLLANSSALPGLLAELAAGGGAHVRGVLVEADGAGVHNMEASHPQAAFAPGSSGGRVWNPDGTGQLWQRLQLPIIALDAAAVAQARQRAAANHAKAFKGALHHASLDGSMQAGGGSRACLAQGTCDPLGGHTVLATLPPVAPDAARPPMPAILVTAGLDGLGLFHDDIVGADAPISGLVALLAAAELLGNASASASYTRRLVFAALAGEPWGFMGSKRLLWELHSGGNATAPLRLRTFEQVLELGPLGRAAPGPAGASLFFHGPTTGSELWRELSAAATGSQVSLSPASGSALPPSSLWSFLRANRTQPAGLLAEFDASLTERNPAYASSADTHEALNAEGIAAAAALAARALHRLAGGSGALQVDRQALGQTVGELLACLARKNGVAGCRLGRSLTTAVGQASNYVGVLHTLTADSQDANLYVKSDVSRFLWNFLALRLSAGQAALASGKAGGCDGSKRGCEAGAVCVGFRPGLPQPEGLGSCQRATARFAPAFSTAIACQGCDGDAWGQWRQSNASAAWEAALGWPPDACYAESRWEPRVPSLLLLQRESKATEERILLAGVLVTGGTLLLTLAAKAAHARRLKRQ